MFFVKRRSKNYMENAPFTFLVVFNVYFISLFLTKQASNTISSCPNQPELRCPAGDSPLLQMKDANLDKKSPADTRLVVFDINLRCFHYKNQYYCWVRKDNFLPVGMYKTFYQTVLYLYKSLPVAVASYWVGTSWYNHGILSDFSQHFHRVSRTWPILELWCPRPQGEVDWVNKYRDAEGKSMEIFIFFAVSVVFLRISTHFGWNCFGWNWISKREPTGQGYLLIQTLRMMSIRDCAQLDPNPCMQYICVSWHSENGSNWEQVLWGEPSLYLHSHLRFK